MAGKHRKYLASTVVRKTGWIANLDNLASESDMPIRVPHFVRMDVETVFHGGYIKRQQTVTGAREKLDCIARLENHLLGNHLKMERQGGSGFVLEFADHAVICWRHSEGLLLADFNRPLRRRKARLGPRRSSGALKC